MTEYATFHRTIPLTSSSVVQEKKAARRKLLDEVERRRQENYKRWYKKMQLKAQSPLDTIA